MANLKDSPSLSPAVTAIVIIVVLAVLVAVGWKLTQPKQGIELKPGMKGPGYKGMVGPGKPGPKPGESWYGEKGK